MNAPPYRIRIKRSAEKEMDRLDRRTFNRLTQAILKLESEPRPAASTQLRGLDAYRLRVGVYRVLYTVDDAARQVEVFAVGHRREVYRDL